MFKERTTLVLSIVFIILIIGTEIFFSNKLKKVNQELEKIRENEVKRQKEWVYKLDELEDLREQNESKIEILSSDLDKVSTELTTMTELNKTLKNKLANQEEENKQLKRKLEKQEVVNKQASRGGSRNKKLAGTFTATAYGDNPSCQGKWVGKTASGMKPQRGVIAVDPRVIPLGTKLYIPGYGNCIAGDTGGAIKGHKVDLFMNSKSERKKFGRRQVRVYYR